MKDSLLISLDLQYSILPSFGSFHQVSPFQPKQIQVTICTISPFYDILFLRGKRFRLRFRSSPLYYPQSRKFFTDVFLLFNDQIHGCIFFFYCKNLLREQKSSAALKEVCTPFRPVPKDQSHDRFKLIEVFYSPDSMWSFL